MSRRILVVEDDLYIRETIRDVLVDEGHRVDCAENGAVALAQLQAMEELPDLILLDLMMPVKDGFAFRAEQRVHPRLAAIPVVVMSADPRLDARREQLGARAYLHKPIDLDLLVATAAG